METAVVPEACRSAWSIMMDRRDQLRAGLGHTGIPVTIYYPQRLHLQPGFAELDCAAGDRQIAEFVSLPNLPSAIDCFDNIDASFPSMGNTV